MLLPLLVVAAARSAGGVEGGAEARAAARGLLQPPAPAGRAEGAAAEGRAAGGHRRRLQTDVAVDPATHYRPSTGPDCVPCGDLVKRLAAVDAACCAAEGDDCSSGRPATCSARCAPVLLRFFTECSAQLGYALARQYNDVVKLCRAEEGDPSLDFSQCTKCVDDMSLGLYYCEHTLGLDCSCVGGGDPTPADGGAPAISQPCGDLAKQLRSVNNAW